MKLEKTITSIFIVPTLKLGKGAIRENGFINGFLYNELLDVDYEDVVYVVFKPENIERFQDFLSDQYETTKNIVEDFDYEGGFVIIVYKLEEKYKKDFDIIKTGKYSKTSQTFQNLFPKKITVEKGGLRQESYSLQYKIFNKTQDLLDYWEDATGATLSGDQELWEGFHRENETLNLKNIEVNVEQQ